MTRLLFALSLFVAACGGGSSNQTPTQPAPPTQGAFPAGSCIKTGCGSTVCAEPGQEVMTTCEFRPEHACYRDAKCERQANGACGWTETPELQMCRANPPPVQ